ncbi:gtp binding protein [Plasmopara halstedii]|uniref:Gtp binding protein n=1 Tax=Plasmopara halstedii TaxID=4781 RepID=A0A0P1ARH4_PLAHL|nr:gtp binding protein [Plasmopara halstedii]CEG43798.1 gtp binding protein [Plasmopara halstedii]|eukprot:XP_024580167.1 gtp binding protein [Plasmopara halstedii]
MELIIGCVGKPSAGKSTFFNAVTDGNAKVGNFPFTTIEPNEGITYYITPCPCLKKQKTSVCTPRYGKCEQGMRSIPIKLLDIAGLLPGASQGAGLGNQFLDDLRHAHVLMHILDVSGHTNEKGEETKGYDPLNDAEWFDLEVEEWIFKNLWTRWTSIVRRHERTKSSLLTTLSHQFSGYGATSSLVMKVLDQMEVKEPVDLSLWKETQVRHLVSIFRTLRFPTILVLNKADQGDETDRNIERIVNKYGSERCFVASAAAECFLKQACKLHLIRYEPGAMTYTTFQDEKDQVETRFEPLKPILKPKIAKRLERIADLVLFRFGSTGVHAAINGAVGLADIVIVYPVKSLKSFATNMVPGSSNKGIFADAILVKRGTTIKEVAYRISHFVGSNFAYAEGEDGRRCAEDERITSSNFILKFTMNITSTQHVSTTSVQVQKDNKKGSKKSGKVSAQE